MPNGQNTLLCFLERLRDIRHRQAVHPWVHRLYGLEGRVGPDGVERVSTEQVFELLSLPLADRTPSSARTLRPIMASLGWTATRLLSASARGGIGRARGYTRLRSPSS